MERAIQQTQEVPAVEADGNKANQIEKTSKILAICFFYYADLISDIIILANYYAHVSNFGSTYPSFYWMQLSYMVLILTIIFLLTPVVFFPLFIYKYLPESWTRFNAWTVRKTYKKYLLYVCAYLLGLVILPPIYPFCMMFLAAFDLLASMYTRLSKKGTESESEGGQDNLSYRLIKLFLKIENTFESSPQFLLQLIMLLQSIRLQSSVTLRPTKDYQMFNGDLDYFFSQTVKDQEITPNQSPSRNYVQFLLLHFASLSMKTIGSDNDTMTVVRNAKELHQDFSAAGLLYISLGLSAISVSCGTANFYFQHLSLVRKVCKIAVSLIQFVTSSVFYLFNSYFAVLNCMNLASYYYIRTEWFHTDGKVEENVTSLIVVYLIFSVAQILWLFGSNLIDSRFSFAWHNTVNSSRVKSTSNYIKFPSLSYINFFVYVLYYVLPSKYVSTRRKKQIFSYVLVPLYLLEHILHCGFILYMRAIYQAKTGENETDIYSWLAPGLAVAFTVSIAIEFFIYRTFKFDFVFEVNDDEENQVES